jgi:rhodanese-related sulfurtransferase
MLPPPWESGNGLDLGRRSADHVRHGRGKPEMPQRITTSVRTLVEQAEKAIETLPVDEAIRLHGDDGVVLVDIRDIRELQRDGRVPGAFHCPRGMLEFWIDPESPYHKEVFAQDKRFVFFCAGGLRSALAADTAHRMGLKPVAHIKGGFGAWKKAGGPVEQVPSKSDKT